MTGGGVARRGAVAGYRVACTDVAADALERGRQDAESRRFGIAGAVALGELSAAEAGAARARIAWTPEFAEAASCDLVIECVPERLDLKLRAFRDLDAAAPPQAILASNTSSFSLAAIAGATARPERAIVWHWASPAYVMKFAEIVTSAQTDPAVTETVVAVAKRCGKNPIVVKDEPLAPGFVANRVDGAMLREAARVVEEGVASHERMDQLMVDCFRWPVGPFAMGKGATSGWKK